MCALQQSKQGMNVAITGASRGLGRAMAERFAEAGHSLFLCSQSEVSIESAAVDLRRDFPGIKLKTHTGDLSLRKEAQRCGRWILEQTANGGNPRLDVLINNAGQYLPGDISDEPEGNLEKMMEVNLYSAYHLTRALLPQMLRQGSGHIVNICSIASLQAYPGGGAYSISKAALSSFSKNLREELKPAGIRVTAVYPGAVWTDSWKGSGVKPERIMEASDIAEMVYAATRLSSRAVAEDIILRPQLGDL
jgi:short-subunit dehydrogenase